MPEKTVTQFSPLPPAKVYVKIDNADNIICCAGGFSEPKDLTDWHCIDEGAGEKYYHCQIDYFEGGLYTQDGVPRWKFENDKPVLRTDTELEAERKQRESNQIQEPDYDSFIIDHEYHLTLLELGV